MKRAAIGLAVAAILGISDPTHAKIGTLDSVPAATLLLPYFEVDANDPNGINTIFTVNNASATAILTRVTLWTDFGLPTHGFNLYLTGYDSQEVNLRTVFSGQLPRTASVGQDPQDTVSNKGPVSQDINYASCNSVLPYAPLDAATVTYLRNAHSGKATSNAVSGANRCFAQDLGDGHLRGYVTIDTVNQCSADPLVSPASPGYFGFGIATDQNVLWGDFKLVQPRGIESGERMVPIEADAFHPGTSIPGEYTFYARFVAATAADHREALGSVWGSNYVTDQSDFIVWRENGQTALQFRACGQDPTWYPLRTDVTSGVQVDGVSIIFDAQEHAMFTDQFPGPIPLPGSEPIAFPAVTNRTRVGSEALPVPFKSGWMLMNLNVAPFTFLAPAGQSYLLSLEDLEGQGVASTMSEGTVIETYEVPPTPTPGIR